MSEAVQADRAVSAASLAEMAEAQLRAVEEEIERLHQRLSELKPERARLQALTRAGRRRALAPADGDSVGSQVLQYASRNGGGFTFQEAIQATGLTSNSVGSTVSRLVNAGRLVRVGRAEYRLSDDEA